MNILSFDIEEWYIEKVYRGARHKYYDMFEGYLNRILDLLDEQETKATFFVVGKMALDFSEIVKRIDGHGHEIGCHSNCHTWISKMNRNEFFEDTSQAVNNLEQCIGKKVKAYRAPAFSIGEGNLWAFEVLSQCGIEYDSSVFPACRDFGGFRGFASQTPTVIRTKEGVVKEFPIPLTHLMKADVAFSGGGYFRFFPLWFVKHQMNQRQYNMCYFHIGDLMPSSHTIMSKEQYEEYFKEKATWVKRFKRHVKSNLGKKRAFDKMTELVRSYNYNSIEQASFAINWNDCPIEEIP